MTSDRCPECGQAFDRSQLKWARKIEPEPRYWANIFLGIAIIGGGIGYRGPGNIPWWDYLQMILMAVSITLWLRLRWAWIADGRRHICLWLIPFIWLFISHIPENDYDTQIKMAGLCLSLGVLAYIVSAAFWKFLWVVCWLGIVNCALVFLFLCITVISDAGEATAYGMDISSNDMNWYFVMILNIVMAVMSVYGVRISRHYIEESASQA